MRLPSRLRVSRHGIYQFRLLLPDVLAVCFGQREIRRTLGTRDPQGAKLLAYGLSARILPVLDRLTRTMTLDPKKITPEEARRLVAENLVIEGGTIKATRLETSPDPEVAARELASLAELARASQQIETRRGSAEAKEIFAATAPPPTAPRPVTIKQAIAAFKIYKQGSASSSADLYEQRLDTLAKLAGGEGRKLHMVTEIEGAEIAQALLVLPAYRKDVPKASELLANPPQGKRLAAGTVRDYLVLFTDFFMWAIRAKHHPGPNPFREAPRPKPGAEIGGAEAFTESELRKIFDAANLDPRRLKRPYHFWGPLFGLFTGARANEIAQLRLADFVEEDGQRCIRIRHDPNADTPTRTKNAASVRTLPLHPTLWAIGLQRYLDDVKRIGGDRLFPTLPLDAKGKREKYFSRDFNTGYLNDIGIHDKRRKVFHSFRDTTVQALTDKEVGDFYIEAWIGHAHESVTSKHYRTQRVPPGKLAEVCLPALAFPFLDFEAIRYPDGLWNAWMKRNLKP